MKSVHLNLLIMKHPFISTLFLQGPGRAQQKSIFLINFFMRNVETQNFCSMNNILLKGYLDNFFLKFID